MGKEAYKEKVLWTGLSGTCGGHVAGPWRPGATSPACEGSMASFPPPSCLGEGRSKQAWGALQSQKGDKALPIPSCISWRPVSSWAPSLRA